MNSTRSNLGLLAPLILALPGFAAVAPLQVGRTFPAFLDLQEADPGRLVPNDPRDPAQVEAAQSAWQARIAPLKQEPAQRLPICPPNRENSALIADPPIADYWFSSDTNN